MKPTGKQCPGCKKHELVIRQNKRTKQDFLGCTSFPLCKWTYSPKTIVSTAPWDDYLYRQVIYQPDPTIEQVLETYPSIKSNT